MGEPAGAAREKQRAWKPCSPQGLPKLPYSLLCPATTTPEYGCLAQPSGTWGLSGYQSSVAQHPTDPGWDSPDRRFAIYTEISPGPGQQQGEAALNPSLSRCLSADLLPAANTSSEKTITPPTSWEVAPMATSHLCHKHYSQLSKVATAKLPVDDCMKEVHQAKTCSQSREAVGTLTGTQGVDNVIASTKATWSTSLYVK